MTCNRCHNAQAWHIKSVYDNGLMVDCCDRCGVSGTFYSPEVYFKEPYWDPHLGSEEDPGPKYITSREQKALLLKKNNLREAGDRVHGATSFDPKYSRTAHENFRKQQEKNHAR